MWYWQIWCKQRLEKYLQTVACSSLQLAVLPLPREEAQDNLLENEERCRQRVSSNPNSRSRSHWGSRHLSESILDPPVPLSQLKAEATKYLASNDCWFKPLTLRLICYTPKINHYRYSIIIPSSVLLVFHGCYYHFMLNCPSFSHLQHEFLMQTHTHILEHTHKYAQILVHL